MGRIQDVVYAADTIVGTASQALGLGGYLATAEDRNPLHIALQGYELAMNAGQVYSKIRNNGGIRGIADNPDLYTGREMIKAVTSSLGSVRDLRRLPDRLREVREEESKWKRALRYASITAETVGDILNIADTTCRVSRKFGANF